MLGANASNGIIHLLCPRTGSMHRCLASLEERVIGAHADHVLWCLLRLFSDIGAGVGVGVGAGPGPVLLFLAAADLDA
eukprot:485970-Pyramimonas_sp.AAC.1